MNLKFILQLAAVIVFAACYTTRTIQPARLATTPAVQTQAGQLMTVEWPRVSGDTLRGMVEGLPAQFFLSSGTVIQTRQAAPARTAALVLLGGAAIVAGAVLIENSLPGDRCQPIVPFSRGAPPSPALRGSRAAVCCQARASARAARAAFRRSAPGIAGA